MQLPSLKHLRVFEAVGRLGNVRQAAAELGLDHSVASRHLRAMQEELGITLIEGSRRGMRLTDSGRRFHESVAAALLVLQAAAEEARREAKPNQLVVWCIPGFALRWLTPRLEAFQKANPRIELTIRSADIPADLPRPQVDAAINYGEAGVPGMRSVALARPRVFPVASPAWIARHPQSANPAGIRAMALLHEENERQWAQWFEAAGVAPPPSLPGPRLWHAHLAIEAAKRGQGVALANELLVEDELASGHLVEIGATDIRLAAYTLAVRADRWSHPAAERFRLWLTRALAAKPGR
jgi:DNA-binding transcriptional LysR family regulator